VAPEMGPLFLIMDILILYPRGIFPAISREVWV